MLISDLNSNQVFIGNETTAGCFQITRMRFMGRCRTAKTGAGVRLRGFWRGSLGVKGWF